MIRAAARAGCGALCAAALSACELAPPPPPRVPPPRAASPAPPAPVEITLLYTSDEHGWLVPHRDKDHVYGGAAQVLGQWIAHEGHCPGPMKTTFGSVEAKRPAGCEDPRTIAISGGDNYTGPAVTTFFGGEPMAIALARMGYVASAFGNHEFDFGRDRFLANRTASSMVYLGANMTSDREDMRLPKFVVVERRGVRVAIVGIATDTTLSTAMASRFAGVDFTAEEPALDEAIREAWATKPDAVVAIAHECPAVLEPIVRRHPEWNLAFFGGAHCHKVVELDVGGLPLLSVGWRLGHYARVSLAIDRARPLGQRVVSRRAEIVTVVDPPPATADAPLVAAIDGYKARLEESLGEVIGFSDEGLARDSRGIAQWIGASWRRELGTDAAILNLGGIRQGVPKGPIKLSTIWSVLPFDNRIMIMRITGAELLADSRAKEMATSGVELRGGRYVFENGKPVDPKQVYSVATIDFLYFGGEHTPFQQQDPAARDAGIDWRAPVIAWTRSAATSPKSPLERRIPSIGLHSP